MICYKDKTFCQYHMLCKNKNCTTPPLTKEVEEDAQKWWGGEGAPICVYANFPDCFIRFFDDSLTGDFSRKE